MTARPASSPFDAFERPLSTAAHRPAPIPLAQYRDSHQPKMFPAMSDDSARAVAWVMYVLMTAVIAVFLLRLIGVI